MNMHYYFLQLKERKKNDWDLEILSREWVGTLSKDLFYFLSLTLFSKTKTHAILI